jgi:hypothetical protein
LNRRNLLFSLLIFLLVSASLSSTETTFSMFGFRFSAEQIEANENGFIATSIHMIIPAGSFNDEESRIFIEEMKVNEKERRLLEFVYIDCNIPLTKAYGPNAAITSIKLGGYSASASEITITLPANQGGEQIVFQNSQIFGNGSISQSSETSISSINLAGFTNISATEVSFSSRGIKLGKMIVPSPESLRPNEIEFKNTVIDNSGIIEKGDGINQRVYFEQDGWRGRIQCWLYNEGIVGEVEFNLNRNLGNATVTFPEVKINGSNDVNFGIAEEGLQLRIGGWRVLAQDATFENGLLIIGEGHVKLYSTMGGDTLKIPNIKIDSNGRIVDSGYGEERIEFLSTNGQDVIAENYKITQSGIVLQGRAKLPGSLQSDDRFPFNIELFLNSNGQISNPNNSTSELEFQVGGWPVKTSGINYQNMGFVATQSILMIWEDYQVNLGDVSFYGSGELYEDVFQSEGQTIVVPNNNFEIYFDDFILKDESLTAVAWLKNPITKEGSIYLDRVRLDPRGYIETLKTISQHRFDLGNFYFIFRNIEMDQSGLNVREVLITMPDTEELDGRVMRFSRPTIDSNGDFDISRIGMDPFQLFGYTMYFDEIQILDSKMILKGGARFRMDNPIINLAGYRFSINELTIDLQDDSVTIDASLDQSFNNVLIGSYFFDIHDIDITPDSYVLSDAVMYVFVNNEKRSIPVSGIRVDPINQTMDLQSIKIHDYSFNIDDLALRLDQLQMEENGSLLLSGDVNLTALNLGFESGLVNVTVNAAGSIQDITISVDGQLYSYVDGELTEVE